MVGGVDGEEEKGGEVMIMHGNKETDQYLMRRGSTGFSASYDLTVSCRCSRIASEGVFNA